MKAESWELFSIDLLHLSTQNTLKQVYSQTTSTNGLIMCICLKLDIMLILVKTLSCSLLKILLNFLILSYTPVEKQGYSQIEVIKLDINLKHLRKNYKKGMLFDTYLTLISTIASNIFKYNTPDFNQTEYDISIQTGLAAFYKCTDKNSKNYNLWCCTPAKNADTSKNDGIADKITTFGSDYALELTVDKDCILIENSSLHFPDFLFCHFAELFTETELSMRSLVKWSRMTPIPIVANDNDIVKYSAVMQNVLDGKEINVISDSTKLLTDKSESIDDRMLRLTDENSIEKMHFFSEYHEQLMRRLSTLGGMPFTSTAKSSQNLKDELHDMDLFSTIYLADRHNARKKGFERAEIFMFEKYGEKFSFNFDYNDNIKKQLERVSKEIENGGVDNVDTIQSE